MVSGRDSEHMPAKDYLGMLQSQLRTCKQVQSLAIGGCNKAGGASADLRAGKDMVTVEHASRRLTITTAEPAAVVTKVKTVWRHTLHGPNLRDRGTLHT